MAWKNNEIENFLSISRNKIAEELDLINKINLYFVDS